MTDVYPVLLSAQAMVLFSAFEGLSTAVQESMACGLPVISSELSSVRVYLPGREAILVKNNEPPVFASILRDLLRNPEKRAAMSEQALLRAKQLSWPNIAKQYDDFYTEILADKQK